MLSKNAAKTLFQWHHEYNNFNIVNDVFNHIDAIVVLSIWEENSPLVIHEAQQCRIPVITVGFGGWASWCKMELTDLRSNTAMQALLLKQY
jgi:hypothetical protein